MLTLDMVVNTGSDMYYPAYMTAEDIMKFEYEINRIIDIERDVGFLQINAQLQEIAENSVEIG
jgi:hypothetical protein